MRKERRGTTLDLCCSVAQLCPTLCDPMDCSTPGLPVHHQLLQLAQIHVPLHLHNLVLIFFFFGTGSIYYFVIMSQLFNLKKNETSATMTKFHYILFRGSFLPLSPANTVNCCTAAQSPSLSRQSCSVALREPSLSSCSWLFHCIFVLVLFSPSESWLFFP